MAVNIQEAIKDWVVSPPHAYIKLKKTLEDPRSSFKEFSAIIGNDPALTARLLKLSTVPFTDWSVRSIPPPMLWKLSTRNN